MTVENSCDSRFCVIKQVSLNNLSNEDMKVEIIQAEVMTGEVSEVAVEMAVNDVKRAIMRMKEKVEKAAVFAGMVANNVIRHFLWGSGTDRKRDNDSSDRGSSRQRQQ